MVSCWRNPDSDLASAISSNPTGVRIQEEHKKSDKDNIVEILIDKFQLIIIHLSIGKI